jgi:hypothetical protein
MKLATVRMALTDWQQVFQKLPQDLLLMLQISPVLFTLCFAQEKYPQPIGEIVLHYFQPSDSTNIYQPDTINR